MNEEQEMQLIELRKKLEDPENKAKFDELYVDMLDGRPEEIIQEIAEREGFANVTDFYLYKIKTLYGSIDMAYLYLQREKEGKREYLDLINKYLDILIKEGFSKEEIDKIIEKGYSPSFGGGYNGELNVADMLFVLETLRVFKLYDPETSKIEKAYRDGGDLWGYNDGPILGYVITMNDGQKYIIELQGKIKDEGTILKFGESSDPEQLKQEQEMLSHFIGFDNNISERHLAEENNKFSVNKVK